MQPGEGRVAVSVGLFLTPFTSLQGFILLLGLGGNEYLQERGRLLALGCPGRGLSPKSTRGASSP